MVECLVLAHSHFDGNLGCGGWAAELQKSTRNLPEISDKMVFLPDSLLSAVFSCLDAPADFAHWA